MQQALRLIWYILFRLSSSEEAYDFIKTLLLLLLLLMMLF